MPECSATLQVRYGDGFVEELHLPVEILSFDADRPLQTGTEATPQPPTLATPRLGLSRAAALPWAPAGTPEVIHLTINNDERVS